MRKVYVCDEDGAPMVEPGFRPCGNCREIDPQVFILKVIGGVRREFDAALDDAARKLEAMLSD